MAIPVTSLQLQFSLRSSSSAPKTVSHGQICNRLLMQLTELNLERNKMNTEKVNLENQLEAEQEYILNKLHKQVDASCTDALHVAHVSVLDNCCLKQNCLRHV